VKLKKKRKAMIKVDRLENSKRRPSSNYMQVDRETELIYRMDNQKFKNLHQLDNFKVLLDKRGSITSE